MRAAQRAASVWRSEERASARPEPGSERAGVQSPAHIVMRRLLRAADFERVLRTRSQGSTTHFAAHHVADHPGLAIGPHTKAVRPTKSTALPAELSTGPAVIGPLAVDDCAEGSAIWLGAVVPKRHARRSVTRTLLKRQIRAVVSTHADSLKHGLWVIRLRAPFDRAVYASAASDALKCAVRTELVQLLGRAALIGRAARGVSGD